MKKVNSALPVMLDLELSLMAKQLKLITVFSVSDEKQ
jgi:hypothetical protein